VNPDPGGPPAQADCPRRTPPVRDDDREEDVRAGLNGCGITAFEEPHMPKRSLILAGGGLKVGFQAGVLQVWLDEAGLTFDHADGASGGTFNLSMYCQGMTGQQMADNWRNLNPFLPVGLNWQALFQFLGAPSLFTLDNFRSQVLPAWGIDWDKVRAGTRLGTFNYFNFSKKKLETITNATMTEDIQIASVSLPMWFPPVKINGDTCIDSVYISDANVQEAIRRGADEIWAIWTVSTQDVWRDGFVNQYFQIIETVADTNFFTAWRRIEENNRLIAAGQPGEYGRTITLKLLQAEVPVHYIFNLSRERMTEAVDLGVTMAREWCRTNNIPLRAPAAAPAGVPAGAPAIAIGAGAGAGAGAAAPATPGVTPPAATAPPVAAAKVSLGFSERMVGPFALGVSDPDAGKKKGATDGTDLEVNLTIAIADSDKFFADPTHEGSVTGNVISPLVNGTRQLDGGIFNLFVDADPTTREKQLRYRLFFKTDTGEARTLYGIKHVVEAPGNDIWTATSTLFTTLYRGTVQPGGEAAAEALGAGIIHIEILDFIRQLTTFRAEGGSLGDRLGALNRFGLLFLGKIWDIYGPVVVPGLPQS
jgi:predicted acylesterase/phospholipase RssA